MRAPRLVMVVSEDWYLCSHRMPVVKGALAEGYEVVIATRVGAHGDAIRAAGARVAPVPIERGRIAPLADLVTVRALARLYRRERPDLVHHVAMKPVLYGSAAAALAGVRRTVNAVAGLGFVFVSRDARARALRPLLRAGLRFALRRAGSACVVQNPDDRALVEGLGVAPDRVAVVRGSGVDLERFAPSPEPAGPVRVTLVSRLLWDKGVGEFVAAARALRATHPEVRFTLVGDPDPANPAGIPRARVQAWQEEGVLEWWGRRDDVPAVWAASHVAVLPSYREGLPLALAEAAACARPIVATDVPGCREVVRDGENGLLVPARDARALAGAIVRLVDDAALRARMGAAGRVLAERELGVARVVDDTLAVYRRLLAAS